jgi:hypothetical protein
MPKATLILFSVMLLFSACIKTDTVNQQSNQKAIATVVRNFQTYEYATGVTGTKDVAKIITQALNFKKSEIVKDATTNGEAIYYYEARQGFEGNETIEIETTESSKKTIVKISLTVTK